MTSSIRWWVLKRELNSSTLLWNPRHGRQNIGRPYKSFIDQIREDTNCSQEEIPAVMKDRIGWSTMPEQARNDDQDTFSI